MTKYYCFLLISILLGACNSPTSPRNAAVNGTVDSTVDRLVEDRLGRHELVLLGEVHDNAAQHALRARWLSRMDSRRRIVLAMEQFDVDRQADLDQAIRDGADAETLARRAGFRFEGWHWPFYRPYVELALSRHWPIVAINLPARDAMAAGRDPSRADSLIEGIGLTADERERLLAAIREGHCGLLPAAALPGIARAQQARDARMARAIVQARRRFERPVVVLAGNGHVRSDLGVPRYLSVLDPRASVESIGLVESATPRGTDLPRIESGRQPYDLTVMTPEQPRPDPCERLKPR